MDRPVIEDDEGTEALDLPRQDVIADVEAGLDDLKHGRTVPVEVVLQSLKAKREAWEAKMAKSGRNGEARANALETGRGSD